MSSVFPGALDTIATDKNNATTMFTDHAAHHDQMAAAINSIQVALGVSPAPMLWRLGGSVSAGANTVPLVQSPPPGFASRASVFAIDVGSASCEIRAITSVSGATLTLDRALKSAHSAAAPVVWLVHNSVPTAFFGVKADGATDDTAAYQAAVDEASLAGIWLDGLNPASIAQMSGPIFTRSGARLRNLLLRATAGWAPVDAGSPTGATDTANAMIMSYQGNSLAFTADASTDTVTTASAHGMASDLNKMAFVGANLPSPLVSGRIYWSVNRGSTTMQVAATSGGTPINLTSAGSGTMTVYTQINALERLLLEDIYLSAFSAVGNINGICCALQQPVWWKKVRVDFCAGYGVALKGQEGRADGLEITHCGTGLLLNNAAKEFYFYDTNIESCTTAGMLLDAGTDASTGVFETGFWGLHMESNPIHVHMKHGREMTFQAVHAPTVNNSDIGLKIEAASTNNISYKLIGWGAQGTPATSKIVNDTNRGFDILRADTAGGASAPALNDMSQECGSFAPTFGWRRLQSLSANYTTVITDDTILMSASGGARTVTLMTAVGAAGKRFTVKKTDASANTVTVATTSSQTIDGVTTKTLAAQYSSIAVVSDGANWMVV